MKSMTINKNQTKLQSGIRLAGILFMLPAFIMILLTIIIPLIWNIILSFTQWNGNSPMSFVFFQNYHAVFADRITRFSLLNSLFIGFVSTFVAMVIGIVLAICLYRFGRNESSFFRFVFFSPSMMPMTVIGLLFVFILAPDGGLVNGFLNAVGLSSLIRGWLSERGIVNWVLACIQGWKFSGIIMMLCFTGLLTIPQSLFEAAKLEGSSYWQELKLIILPLIRPTINLSLSMMLVWSFKSYDIVWTMTKGGPGDISKTAPIRMIETAFSYNQFGFSSAIGVVLTLVVGLSILLSRKAMKGESYEY